MDVAVFALTWIALLGVPLAGAVVAWSWRRNRAASIVLSASEGLTVLVVLCWNSGLQASSMPANSAVCIAAGFAWCALGSASWWACWQLRPRALGIAAGVLATLTLLPCFTIGILFAWVEIGDGSSPPLQETEIRPGLSCRVEGWGLFAQNGYTVYLYRYAPAFPALRREVAHASVGAGDRPASCRSVAAASGY